MHEGDWLTSFIIQDAAESSTGTFFGIKGDDLSVIEVNKENDVAGENARAKSYFVEVLLLKFELHYVYTNSKSKTNVLQAQCCDGDTSNNYRQSKERVSYKWRTKRRTSVRCLKVCISRHTILVTVLLKQTRKHQNQ